MKPKPLLTAVITLLVCVGCGQSPARPGPAVPVPATTPATAVSATPSPPSSPSASPSSSAFPAVPDPSDALDVSTTVTKAGFASFASPSGKIWCAIYAEDALCHFPYDYSGAIPGSESVCPGETELDVTGVMVDAESVGYFCSGDPEANPALEDSDSVATTAWWKATGWPSVKLDGRKLATLPYGKALTSGNFVCVSLTSGVRCADTANGKTFQMARAGVQTTG